MVTASVRSFGLVRSSLSENKTALEKRPKVQNPSPLSKERLTLEHVDHVLEVNERVVDGDDVGGVVDDRVTEDDTSDTAETVRSTEK